MEILITKTDEICDLDGVPVRRWDGRTAGGVPCEVFVHRVMVHNDLDTSAFEAELREVGTRAEDRTPAEQAAADPRFAAFLEAVQRYGTQLLRFELPVSDVMTLVSAVQLALRHPMFPARIRPYVERFLGDVEGRLARLAPVFAEVVRLGKYPRHDMRADGRERDA